MESRSPFCPTPAHTPEMPSSTQFSSHQAPLLGGPATLEGEDFQAPETLQHQLCHHPAVGNTPALPRHQELTQPPPMRHQPSWSNTTGMGCPKWHQPWGALQAGE